MFIASIFYTFCLHTLLSGRNFNKEQKIAHIIRQKRLIYLNTFFFFFSAETVCKIRIYIEKYNKNINTYNEGNTILTLKFQN